MNLAEYPPEIVARAMLQLSTALVERMSKPLPYGDLDLDRRRARFLDAVAEVRAVSDRAVMRDGQRERALARFRRWLEAAPEGDRVSLAQLEVACAELLGSFDAAMAEASAFIDRLRGRLQVDGQRPVVANASPATEAPLASHGPSEAECEDLATMLRLFAAIEHRPQIAARPQRSLALVEPLPKPDARLPDPPSDDPVTDVIERGFDVVEGPDGTWSVIRERDGIVHTLSRGHDRSGDGWDWLLEFVFGPAGSPSDSTEEYAAEQHPNEPEGVGAAAM